jgi:hypothetical protein
VYSCLEPRTVALRSDITYTPVIRRDESSPRLLEQMFEDKNLAIPRTESS